MDKYLNNPHPGEILDEKFLRPLGLSQNALSKAISVPSNRINKLVRGRRGISADTDLRLSRYFGLSDGYWLTLQNRFDMMETRRAAADSIARINPFDQKTG